MKHKATLKKNKTTMADGHYSVDAIFYLEENNYNYNDALKQFKADLQVELELSKMKKISKNQSYGGAKVGSTQGQGLERKRKKSGCTIF